MGRHEAIGINGAASERQTAASVLMVEPASFGFNPETAASNAFALAPVYGAVADRARREFDALAERLELGGVAVHRLADTPLPAKPDAIFPNNWISFHADGTIVTYPMAAPSRRTERRLDHAATLLAAAGFEPRRHVDLACHEGEGRFLEGTGSLILDRPRRRAYACLSNRTDSAVAAEFDERLGYSTMLFRASDPAGLPIYHTNVMMSLGSRYAALCLDAVAEADRARLVEDLEISGRVVIDIGWDQVLAFACNIIELEDRGGRGLIALSSAAYASLLPAQRRALETLAGELVHVPVPTIERVAGGGVRCMIADVHLPKARPAVGPTVP